MLGENYLQDKETKRMRTLIDRLNAATQAYDAGHPYMSDEDWDNLYFELLSAEREAGLTLPDSPTQKISYQIVNQLEKVTHNHKMLSLDKTKNLTEIESFLGTNSFVVMCKMDGLTCSLHYKNGFLIGAETRGDGIVGESIIHNALVIPSIPNHISYLGELIVDGEIICTYKDFEKFSKDYKNPRNFAAGSIRLLDSKECASRNLKFIAWDVIEGLDRRISHFKKDNNGKIVVDEREWFESTPNNYLCYKLLDLAKLGFSVAPWYSKKWSMAPAEDTLQDIVNFLKSEAEKYSYPIDGIVFKFDDIAYGKSLGATAHHFKNAIAYKFYDEIYLTTVKDVEWTMGRTGVLTPVAILEPIEINDAMVTRASMHNYGIMLNELGVTHKGQTVEVCRVNMIIPQIVKAYPMDGDEKLFIPEICPVCGSHLEINNNNGVQTLVCTNLGCMGKLINKFEHFTGKKGLDIKGISKATLEKLMDWGWLNSFEDIFKLKEHEKEWTSKEGFGIKSVKKILDTIENAKVCTLEKFISALGIPLIGVAVAKDLALIFHNDYNEFRCAINNGYNFIHLPNFGSAKANALLNFDYSEADRIFEKYLHIVTGTDLVQENINLKNKIFTITGKLKKYQNRDVLVQIIEAHGGKVTSAVSTKTNYLINNDINSNSSKNLTAKKLGVPIITEDELENML